MYSLSTYSSDSDRDSDPPASASPPLRSAYRRRREARKPNYSDSSCDSALSASIPTGPSVRRHLTESAPDHADRGRIRFSVAPSEGCLVEDVIKRQEAVLAKRRMPMGSMGRRLRRRSVARPGRGDDGASSLGTQGRWEQYLSGLEEDFFSCKDAALGTNFSGGKGSVLYEALRVTEENNDDLKSVHETIYRVKHNLGQPTGSYEGFRSAVGQYCRAYIALRKTNPKFVYDLWKSGKVFWMLSDLRVVQAFLNYFTEHGRAATVRSKAAHLKKMCGMAMTHFTAKNNGELVGKLTAVSEYLRNVCCVQKFQERREHRVRKTEEERVTRAELLTPEDFKSCTQTAKQCLDGIMRTHREMVLQAGERGARKHFEKQGGLRNKWSINFISYLVLQGGGQRPQVYAQLQLPTLEEFTDMKHSVGEGGMVELRTVMEKTARSLDFPNAIFPSSSFCYFKFHVRVIRPAIIRACAFDEAGLGEKTLLVHTKSGESLDSTKITKTLRRFLTAIDPEMKNVTSMSIRGSYATMMLGFYRQGTIFQTKTEQQFLEFLAKMMNTSVEQLTNAYASNGEKDFLSAALELSVAMNRHSESSGEHDPEGSGSEAANWAKDVWG